ncbi:Na+/H+ antiporter NhaA [Catellatospora sp. NPDC049133]|uniref:Na+/H+ antiporter NhaA n=1 Tax=Catellatospora sp. NPDC049133 TaxID=3155499 RepID=UPI0033DE0703
MAARLWACVVLLKSPPTSTVSPIKIMVQTLPSVMCGVQLTGFSETSARPLACSRTSPGAPGHSSARAVMRLRERRTSAGNTAGAGLDAGAAAAIAAPEGISNDRAADNVSIVRIGSYLPKGERFARDWANPSRPPRRRRSRPQRARNPPRRCARSRTRPLGVALIPLAFAVAVQRCPGLPMPPAAATWAFVHASGIHATVAGVLFAFTAPVRSRPGGDNHGDHDLGPVGHFDRRPQSPFRSPHCCQPE